MLDWLGFLIAGIILLAIGYIVRQKLEATIGYILYIIGIILIVISIILLVFGLVA